MQQLSMTARAQAQQDSLDQIRLRIAEAVWTLRHDRCPRHGVPAGYRSSMPEPIKSYWEAYEQTAPKVTRTRPNASQITAMEEFLPWIYMLTPQKRSVVFCRHTPLSWRTVGRILGISHEYARRLEADAVDEIRLAIKRKTVNKNLLTLPVEQVLFSATV